MCNKNHTLERISKVYFSDELLFYYLGCKIKVSMLQLYRHLVNKIVSAGSGISLHVYETLNLMSRVWG